MSNVNRIKTKQQKRGRGRKPDAKIGDLLSIIDKIHHEEDKMDVECVNKLATYYKILRDQAEGKGKYTEIGIKDQTKAIEYCISRAERLLDEYYSEEESESPETPSSKQEDTSPKPLISLAYNGE